MSHTYKFHALVAMFGAIVLCTANVAMAQNAMYVDPTGNVGIGTNTPASALDILRSDATATVKVVRTDANSLQTMFSLLNEGSVKFRMQDTSKPDVRWEFRTAGEGVNEQFVINKIGTSPEAIFYAGGDVVITGSLTQGSSRFTKNNIKPLDSENLLDKLTALEISEWNYKTKQDQRHIGPMAEDFYALFELGQDDKHIAPGDMAGIALAAAKELNGNLIAVKAENQVLRARLEQIEKQLNIGSTN